MRDIHHFNRFKLLTNYWRTIDGRLAASCACLGIMFMILRCRGLRRLRRRCCKGLGMLYGRAGAVPRGSSADKQASECLEIFSFGMPQPNLLMYRDDRQSSRQYLSSEYPQLWIASRWLEVVCHDCVSRCSPLRPLTFAKFRNPRNFNFSLNFFRCESGVYFNEVK